MAGCACGTDNLRAGGGVLEGNTLTSIPCGQGESWLDKDKKTLHKSGQGLQTSVGCVHE